RLRQDDRRSRLWSGVDRHLLDHPQPRLREQQSGICSLPLRPRGRSMDRRPELEHYPTLLGSPPLHRGLTDSRCPRTLQDRLLRFLLGADLGGNEPGSVAGCLLPDDGPFRGVPPLWRARLLPGSRRHAGPNALAVDFVSIHGREYSRDAALRPRWSHSSAAGISQFPPLPRDEFTPTLEVRSARRRNSAS